MTEEDELPSRHRAQSLLMQSVLDAKALHVPLLWDQHMICTS